MKCGGPFPLACENGSSVSVEQTETGIGIANVRHNRAEGVGHNYASNCRSNPTFHVHPHQRGKYLLPHSERAHHGKFDEVRVQRLVKRVVPDGNHAKLTQTAHLQVLHIAAAIRAEGQVLQTWKVGKLHLGHEVHAPIADGNVRHVRQPAPLQRLQF